MKDGMPENDDLSGAVEALFTSAEWERRLADARESRRKILEEKAKSAPIKALPSIAPPEPVEPQAETRRYGLRYMVGGIALLVAGAVLIWPSTPPIVPVTLRHATPPSFAQIPLSRAIVETATLPMRYDLAPARIPQVEMLTFALNADIPDEVLSTVTSPIDEERLVAVPDGLPLAVAPPASMNEVYTDLLARLRAASEDSTMRVHLPPGLDVRRDDMQVVSSPFATPADVVRFYHTEDAPAATAAAGAIGAAVQDFTGYAPTPPEGLLEVWLSAR